MTKTHFREFLANTPTPTCLKATLNRPESFQTSSSNDGATLVLSITLLTFGCPIRRLNSK